MFLPPVLYKPDRRASVPSAVNGYACITSALPLALGHSATKGSLMSDLDVILHHLSHRDASADGYVRCSVRRWEVFSADRCHYLGFTVGASPLGCNFQSLMSLLYRWLSYGIATRSVFASWSMLLSPWPQGLWVSVILEFIGRCAGRLISFTCHLAAPCSAGLPSFGSWSSSTKRNALGACDTSSIRSHERCPGPSFHALPGAVSLHRACRMGTIRYSEHLLQVTYLPALGRVMMGFIF